jgi:hypothetical protein
MAIDKNIYNNGIKGLLSYWEIESLPRDYEFLKGMFMEATEIREGKRKNFDTFEAFEEVIHKPMSRIQQEKRMFQVLSRATFGMAKYRVEDIDKISREQFINGYELKGVNKQPFKYKLHKFMFYLNPVRLWRLCSLYWNLRKLWSEDSKKYREAKKELKALKKEQKKKYKNMQYDMTRNEWAYKGTC